MEQVVPHPNVMDKNSGGIPQETGVPAPQQTPQPKILVPGR